MNRIYLDNAATTPMLSEVKKVMQLSMEIYGNPSSMHEDGRKAQSAIEGAREVIARKIGASPSEIIFTSGGSEANNMILNAMWGQIYRSSERNEIIVSSIEHPSIIEMAKFLKTLGFIIHFLSVDNLGKVNIDEYRKILSKKTLFVSIMMANNEIGTIQDIKELSKLAHENGALFHTDAVQVLGKIPIDVNDLGVDYLSISAHKIGGPKGAGALFVRKDAPINSLILGGHQERGLRAGTENTLAIIGFAQAAKYYEFSHSDTLRNKLQKGIEESISGIVINGDQENCLPNMLNVTFAGIEGESILLKLDKAGIAVSTGSACATEDIKSSHVLMAIGADPEKAHGSIRFSFGPENTSKDIDKVLEVLPGIVSELRKMSTIGGDYE